MEQPFMADSADRPTQAREPRVVRILMRLLGFVLILAAILFLTAGRWDWVHDSTNLSR
jgi:uncharacterized membrane protein